MLTNHKIFALAAVLVAWMWVAAGVAQAQPSGSDGAVGGYAAPMQQRVRVTFTVPTVLPVGTAASSATIAMATKALSVATSQFSARQRRLRAGMSKRLHIRCDPC